MSGWLVQSKVDMKKKFPVDSTDPEMGSMTISDIADNIIDDLGDEFKGGDPYPTQAQIKQWVNRFGTKPFKLTPEETAEVLKLVRERV